MDCLSIFDIFGYFFPTLQKPRLRDRVKISWGGEDREQSHRLDTRHHLILIYQHEKKKDQGLSRVASKVRLSTRIWGLIQATGAAGKGVMTMTWGLRGYDLVEMGRRHMYAV